MAEDGPGDDEPHVERRPHFRVVLGVFLGEVHAGPRDAQGVLQEPAHEGVMVVPRRRPRQQLLPIARQKPFDQLAERRTCDFLAGDVYQGVEHLRAVESRLRRERGRVEAVGGVRVGCLANLADLQLRPVSRLTVHGPELVESPHTGKFTSRVGSRKATLK